MVANVQFQFNVPVGRYARIAHVALEVFDGVLYARSFGSILQRRLWVQPPRPSVVEDGQLTLPLNSSHILVRPRLLFDLFASWKPEPDVAA